MLDLRNVSVQTGSEYSVIIGCDILNGDTEHLKGVSIRPGKNSKWKLHTGVSVVIPQLKQHHAKIHATQAANKPPESYPPEASPAPPPPKPPSIVELTTTVLDAETKLGLQRIANERQR